MCLVVALNKLREKAPNELLKKYKTIKIGDSGLAGD